MNKFKIAILYGVLGICAMDYSFGMNKSYSTWDLASGYYNDSHMKNLQRSIVSNHGDDLQCSNDSIISNNDMYSGRDGIQYDKIKGRIEFVRDLEQNANKFTNKCIINDKIRDLRTSIQLIANNKLISENNKSECNRYHYEDEYPIKEEQKEINKLKQVNVLEKKAIRDNKQYIGNLDKNTQCFYNMYEYIKERNRINTENKLRSKSIEQRADKINQLEQSLKNDKFNIKHNDIQDRIKNIQTGKYKNDKKIQDKKIYTLISQKFNNNYISTNQEEQSELISNLLKRSKKKQEYASTQRNQRICQDQDIDAMTMITETNREYQGYTQNDKVKRKKKKNKKRTEQYEKITDQDFDAAFEELGIKVFPESKESNMVHSSKKITITKSIERGDIVKNFRRIMSNLYEHDKNDYNLNYRKFKQLINEVPDNEFNNLKTQYIDKWKKCLECIVKIRTEEGSFNDNIYEIVANLEKIKEGTTELISRLNDLLAKVFCNNYLYIQNDLVDEVASSNAKTLEAFMQQKPLALKNILNKNDFAILNKLYKLILNSSEYRAEVSNKQYMANAFEKLNQNAILSKHVFEEINKLNLELQKLKRESQQFKKIKASIPGEKALKENGLKEKYEILKTAIDNQLNKIYYLKVTLKDFSKRCSLNCYSPNQNLIATKYKQIFNKFLALFETECKQCTKDWVNLNPEDVLKMEGAVDFYNKADPKLKELCKGYSHESWMRIGETYNKVFNELDSNQEEYLKNIVNKLKSGDKLTPDDAKMIKNIYENQSEENKKCIETVSQSIEYQRMQDRVIDIIREKSSKNSNK